MRVMGIDPGGHLTGFAVIDDAGPTLIDCGTITLNPKHDIGSRLCVLAGDLLDLLTEHKPEVVGVETPFINPKFMSAVIPLSHARGVIVMSVAKYGARRFDLAPSEVRKIVGARQGDKAHTQRAVTALMRLSQVPPEDVADAIAVALAAVSRAGSETTATSNGKPPRPPGSGRKRKE